MSKPRAQLKHALLRVILPSLAKMRSLKRVHGSAGKCSVYEAYMVMSGATDAVVDRDCILSIADDNDVKDPEAFIDYCLEKGLFILDSGGISSTPVIEDQEAYAERVQQNAAEAERKRRERSGGRPADSPRDNPKDVRVNGSGLPVFVSVIDSDLGSKELRDSHPALTEALAPQPLKLPPSFSTPEIRKAVKAWAEKQLKTTGKPFDQIQLDALCMKFKTAPGLLAALVHSCSLSTTRNVYPPPASAPARGGGYPAKAEPAVRRTVDTSKPLTAEEAAPATPEGKAKLRQLIATSLEGKKGAA